MKILVTEKKKSLYLYHLAVIYLGNLYISIWKLHNLEKHRQDSSNTSKIIVAGYTQLWGERIFELLSLLFWWGNIGEPATRHGEIFVPEQQLMLQSIILLITPTNEMIPFQPKNN